MILSVPLEAPSPLKDAKLEEEQKTHVFKSRFPDITIHATVPLHNYLFEKASSFPDRPCLIAGETGKIYTYDETILMCKRTAHGLKKIGVGKGDKIMLVLHNCPEFVFSFMAASMIGAASSTANPFYTTGELSKQMRCARAKTVITHRRYVEKFRIEDREDLVIVTVDDPPEGCVGFTDVCKGDEEGDDVECEVDVDAPVAIPFSSGTTGLPKGVVLTHRGQITNVAQQVDGENPHLHLSEDDVALCVLPLFHVFSLNSVLFCALRRGAAIVLMQKFEISMMLELIQTHKISFVAVVPPLVIALAKNPTVCDYDLTSIRLVLCGAAPLGKDLEQTLQKRMPNAILGQGYGMTEAGPVLTMCAGFAKQPLTIKGGSVGTVVRNAELKIIDPKDGRSLGYNKPGEICIRGQQIMKEYLNDPVSTASTIDVDGWLHSGDIGYVDEDDEVFIVDRVKEIIKYKGFQVAPAELEALLISHESVVDAAVVPLKEDNCGEVPVAFVVKSSEKDVKEEEIKEFVAKQVIFYKKIQKVFFVEAIPKSASGKILRKELRERLASNSNSL